MVGTAFPWRKALQGEEESERIWLRTRWFNDFSRVRTNLRWGKQLWHVSGRGLICPQCYIVCVLTWNRHLTMLTLSLGIIIDSLLGAAELNTEMGHKR